MESLRAILREHCLFEATKALPEKGGRPHFSILGLNGGTWKLIPGYDIGWTRIWDWYASAALSSKNSWKTLMVDNATEHNTGFLKAMREVGSTYPEIASYIIAFDGPFKPMKDILGSDLEFDWNKITFYHGTSDVLWQQQIKREGLRPRAETGSRPAYGSLVGAKVGRDDGVYLTSQLNTALFAARDAARNTGSIPVVLIIKGIDGSRLAPDEDSREKTALASFRKLGSVIYIGTIPPNLIKLRS